MAKPNDGDSQQTKKERLALPKVKLLSLASSPASIVPFGQSTISWRVKIPVSTDPDVVIQTFLDDESVLPESSKQVSPTFSRTYTLWAKGEILSRKLGQTTVSVSLAACDIYASVLPTVFRTQIENLILGSSQIKKRGDQGVVVTFGDFILQISLALEFEIPGANLDVDASIKFSLFETFSQFEPLGKVECSLSEDVWINSSWSILQDILTLGCANVVQAALEQAFKAFLTLLSGQISVQIANALQEEQSLHLTSLKNNDPLHRTFRSHSMMVSSVGVSFVSCPV